MAHEILVSAQLLWVMTLTLDFRLGLDVDFIIKINYKNISFRCQSGVSWL